MNKKTIIIITVLVVLGYLAWKKGWFAKQPNTTTLVDDALSSGNKSLQEVINGTSMTENEKEKTLSMAQSIIAALKAGNTNWSYSQLKAKADANGVSFNQQVVISATFELYQKGLFGKEYWDGVVKEIKAM